MAKCIVVWVDEKGNDCKLVSISEYAKLKGVSRQAIARAMTHDKVDYMEVEGNVKAIRHVVMTEKSKLYESKLWK